MSAPESRERVAGLVRAIRTYIVSLPITTPGIDQVKLGLTSLDLGPARFIDQQPIKPVHEDELGLALNAMEAGEFKRIANQIWHAWDWLNWKVDDGIYYADGADVGDAYRSGNMHCELIGPNYSWVYSNSFKLGLFLLKPGTEYRDHNHTAPEFYLNLTGPTNWRFDHGAWEEFESGSTVWNSSGRVHATTVLDSVFLAVYCWTEDIDSICHVVPTNAVV